MIIVDSIGTDEWTVSTAQYPPEAEKREVGRVVRTPYGFFANPRNSQLQAIPCAQWLDAVYTVERLAR
jgi:hypothetical protein